MPKQPPLSLVSSSLTAPSLESSGTSPPRKLGDAGLSLWHRVQVEFGISDAGSVELLCAICEAQDRLAAIAARITAEGETLRTKTGVRSHPSLRDELGFRAFVCKGLEKLGVTVEPTKAVGRPPGFRA
jgi:hypothetical protein